MFRRRVCTWLAVLGLAWAGGGEPVFAGMAKTVELGELVAGSSDIVRGRIVELNSRWNAAQTLIETDVRLEVAEHLKGGAPVEITWTLPGGRVGDLVLAVVEAPRLSLDEEVLIFLRRDAGGRFTMPYLAIGAYRLEVDEQGYWARSLGYSLGNLLPARASTLDARQRLPWTALRAEIDQAVRKTGGAR